jgi:ribosomal-protein-alanine N-acetyltransferase
MNEMPALETPRLIIQPLQYKDLDAVYNLLDFDLNTDEQRIEKKERAKWLEWTVMNYTQLANLDQPPYGDRAIILRATNTLIGLCGFVPCLNAFEQMKNLPYYDTSGKPGRYSPEFGLYYSISQAHQRKGYAFEAAQALIDYAFDQIHLKRIIATTTYDNPASIAVMTKLGMQIEKNPLKDPPWLQIVGVLENDG